MGKKTNQAIAIEVILGKWGNGNERKTKLTNAGYNYENIQSIVNALCAGDMKDFEQTEDIIIKGTKTKNVKIDLNKYCALNIEFINGGGDDANTGS